MSTISIAKNGGMCEIVINGSPQYFEVNPKDVQLGFNTSTNSINVYFPIRDGIFDETLPMASVTIGGTVITSNPSLIPKLLRFFLTLTPALVAPESLPSLSKQMIQQLLQPLQTARELSMK
jgi:hypothetical protein